jgi:serine/threonine protein kinase
LKTLVHRSKISSKNTLKIIRQIIEAVNILHGSNIVHRDLKMDNILVKDLGGDDLRIKIIDYGECAFMGS